MSGEDTKTEFFPHGIYLESADKFNEFLELLQEDSDNEITSLMIDGNLLSDSFFVNRLQKSGVCESLNLVVRELVSSSMISLMANQNDKIKIEFIKAFEEKLNAAQKLGCTKIIHSFNLVCQDEAVTDLLKTMYGICYKKQIVFELSLRIPQIDREQSFTDVHAQIRKLMLQIGLVLDIHVDENAFMQMDFAEEIRPLIFDISAVHFFYESKFGNRLAADTVNNVVSACSNFDLPLEFFV